MTRIRLSRRRGFTLAELLIVVVIVGVLAAIVVPRFAAQKDKAKTAEAIGIMTNIHRALLQYHDENNSYPALGDDSSLKQELGIDYQASRHGWTFSSPYSDGAVWGQDSQGQLVLNEGGRWNGTSAYAPDTGSLSPTLPWGNTTI